jgi:hypothetical protein
MGKPNSITQKRAIEIGRTIGDLFKTIASDGAGRISKRELSEAVAEKGFLKNDLEKIYAGSFIADFLNTLTMEEERRN